MSEKLVGMTAILAGLVEASALATAGPDGPAHILVVEDNLMNQEIMATLLRYAGYEVTVVDNGRAGYEAVQDSEYDLVLMDLEMPVMGGIEAAHRIRDLGRTIRQIPIIAITANSIGDEGERCRRAGMNGFMTKPTSMRDLLQAARQWIGQAPAVG
jgi:CheY-like chemotaxis protein